MRGDGNVGLCRVRDETLNHLQLVLSDMYEKGFTNEWSQWHGDYSGATYGLYVMTILHKISLGVRRTCCESRLDCL